MAEYIEREDLLNNRPEGRNPGQVGKEDYNKGWNDCRSAFVECIVEEPAADVAPVVHGRWEWRERWETHPETRSCDLIDCGWYCTECGIELGEYLSKKTGQHIILDDDSMKPKLACCPNCGARMDGE